MGLGNAFGRVPGCSIEDVSAHRIQKYHWPLCQLSPEALAPEPTRPGFLPPSLTASVPTSRIACACPREATPAKVPAIRVARAQLKYEYIMTYKFEFFLNL